MLALMLVGIYGVLWLKKDVMIAKITLFVLVIIMGLYCKKYFKITKVKDTICNRKNWYQIGTIAFFVLIFLTCAIINKVRIGMEIPTKIYITLGLLVAAVSLIFFT